MAPFTHDFTHDFVADGLRDAALAVEHDLIDQLGNDRGAIHRIRQHFTLRYKSTSRHGIYLLVIVRNSLFLLFLFSCSMARSAASPPPQQKQQVSCGSSTRSCPRSSLPRCSNTRNVAVLRDRPPSRADDTSDTGRASLIFVYPREFLLEIA